MINRKNARNKGGKRVIVFLILVLILISIGFVAPRMIPNDPYSTNASYRKGAPSEEYPLGTDKLGRCIYSRMLMGAKVSVFSALLVVLISMTAGTMLGVAAGYWGGLVDNLIMGFADLFLAFPQMVFAIAVTGILGGTMINAILALSFTGWTLYARLARAQVMTLKKEEFIIAAKLGGSSSFQILTVHILPAIAGEMIVNAAIQMGSAMLGFAGLSYLGLGAQAPEAEWGSMINEARGYMQQAPWAVAGPGAALFVTVCTFQLFGDSLRDYLGIMSERDEG